MPEMLGLDAKAHTLSLAPEMCTPDLASLDYSAVVVKCYSWKGTNHQNGIIKVRFLLPFLTWDRGESC